MSLIFGLDINKIEPLISGRNGAGGKGKSDSQAQGPTSAFTKNMMHAGLTSAGGAGAGRSMRAAARDRRAVKALGRIARGSPEVMVRVSGKQGTGQHSLANMAYISRIEREEKQHVALEDQDKKIIKSREDMRALSIEWEIHEQEGDDRRKGAVSRSYVLSMPEGTDPAKVKDAARAFARQEFSKQKYVLALHTDTPRPHVHITVAVRDQDLRRHYPKRDDLARYRETFARELRARGIEANATPCKARGVAPKQEHMAKEKMRSKGLVPRHDEQTPAKQSQLNRFDTMLANQRSQAMDIYKNAVEKLRASQDPEHQEIAQSLSKFVIQIPALQVSPDAERAAELSSSQIVSPLAPAQLPRAEKIVSGRPTLPQAPEQREAGPMPSESRKATAKRGAGERDGPEGLPRDNAPAKGGDNGLSDRDSVISRDAKQNISAPNVDDIDSSKFDNDAREMIEAAKAMKADREARALAKEIRLTKDAIDKLGRNRDVDQSKTTAQEKVSGDKKAPSQETKHTLQKVVKDIEKRDRDRARDRGSPKR